MKIHCLFEQSGTFKNVFKKLGYEAFDYDIENKFNETDYVIDLFNEIDLALNNEKSIFDNITSNDLIIAFFPCTYFSRQNDLIFNRQFRWFKHWTEEKINDYIDNRLKERSKFYRYFLKLIMLANIQDIPIIIENPYKNNYLLKVYDKPDLIILDRSLYGDNHIKPTMFYSINFEFKNNDIEFKTTDKDIIKHNKVNGHIRSQLHEEFAYNFIRKHIL